MEGGKHYLWLFVGLFIFSFIMILTENGLMTGHVTTDSTTSSVVISQYFSISLSGNLSNGISFGTQNSTSSTNVNASQNFNGSSQSEYYISVSTDSNTNVNFTIWADGQLNTSGGDEILLGNESYFFNITNSNILYPDVASEVSLTTSPVDAGGEVVAGSSVFYRFWLDIPSGTPTGTYNNTVSFQGAAS